MCPSNQCNFKCWLGNRSRTYYIVLTVLIFIFKLSSLLPEKHKFDKSYYCVNTLYLCNIPHPEGTLCYSEPDQAQTHLQVQTLPAFCNKFHAK